MAIGVRILSDNLSGKTVNVTYLPISGGTIDLGTQTIPFNNIDSNPWGTYQVYVPEYDYTYSLTISNDGLGQTFVLMSTPTGSTSSWASSLLNFGDLTAQVIDYGISTNDWDINNIYPITEKGYLYLFQGRGNFGYNDWLFLATDTAGQSVMQYSGNTGNWEYDDLEGEIAYFAWEDLGVMKYTDGTTGYTFTWTSGTGSGEFDQFNVEWDWDGANRDGKFVFSLWNSNTADKEYYLADHGTHTLLTTSNTNTDNVFFSYQWNSNFFTEFRRDNNNVFQFIKIYNTSGTLTQTYDLTGNTYTNYSLEFFGNNQMFVMFYNWNDTSVDYYIRTYNGTNNQSDFTTHNRSNYTNYNTSSDSGQYPEEYDFSSMSLMLYQTGNNYGNLTGNTVTYCDFIWCLDNSEVLHTEVFQDTGVDDQKAIYTWFNTGKRPVTRGTIGDGNLYSIMLTPTGVSYNSLGTVSSFYYDSFDVYDCAPGYIFMSSDSNDSLNRTMHFISSGNTVTDTQQFTVTDYPWNYNTRERYGLFYLTNYVDSFYANGSTGTITQINGETYNNTYYSLYYDSNLQSGPFVAVNTSTFQARAFDKTSSNSQIQLPANNGAWDMNCGRNRFLYVYNDNNTGNCNVRLYGFDGTLKNSQEFLTSGWDNVWAVKDRYVLIRYENSVRTCYLISDTTITSVDISDYNNYNTLNDYPWYND